MSPMYFKMWTCSAVLPWMEEGCVCRANERSDQTKGVLIGCNRVIVMEESENGSVVRVFEVCGDGVGLVQSSV